MGCESMIFFLVLAIVSITGKIASSSSRKGEHHSRRYPLKMGSESESETFVLKPLDEKQSSPSISYTNSELPMFRIRQAGLAEMKEKATTTLKLEEDTSLLEKRRLLKETLRIVIPDSEMLSRSIRSTRRSIPFSFDLYSDADGRYRDATTLAIPAYLATSKKVPRLRYSYVNGRPALAESRSKQVARETKLTTEGRGQGQLCMNASIEQVGLLKIMQREDRWNLEADTTV